MSADFYIRLTLAVYKVTELFPKDEPLRQNIRDLANEILIGLINEQEKPITTQNRKQEILRVLQEKKKIQLRELIQTFPQVNRRTLMRDLEELYRAGTVIRVGNGRGSCYNIKL